MVALGCTCFGGHGWYWLGDRAQWSCSPLHRRVNWSWSVMCDHQLWVACTGQLWWNQSIRRFPIGTNTRRQRKWKYLEACPCADGSGVLLSSTHAGRNNISEGGEGVGTTAYRFVRPTVIPRQLPKSVTKGKVQDSQEAQAQPPTSMGGPNPPRAHAM